MRLSLLAIIACCGMTTNQLTAVEPGPSLISGLVPSLVQLVDPSLQPSDLFDRHLAVLCLQITSIDTATSTVELRVLQVAKGAFPATAIHLKVADPAASGPFQMLPEVGLEVVAFVGQKGRNRESEVKFYMGGQGRWQVARISAAGDAATAATWDWTQELDKELYGTFNGHPDRLAELVRDIAAGRAFFPSTTFDRFKDDQMVGRLPGPAQAVAMYDVDGDGRPDIIAVGPAGSALFLQREAKKFSEVSDASGLKAVTGSSLDIADVDGDGHPDLLVDGRLLRQDATGRFTDTQLLPVAASAVTMSRFVDLDGDGWPEVVISRADGLHAFQHPGTAGKPYSDATAAYGLDRIAAQGDYFVPGAWLGGGHGQLFVANGSGMLLERGADGVMAAQAKLPGWDFSASGGRTGGGACAPIWGAASFDLAFATDNGINLVAFPDGKAVDVGQYGNETQVLTPTCAGLLAEDLNADGNVDLYAINRTPGSPNTLYDNRGYGSFMVGTRYRAEGIPGQAHLHGAQSAAAGDVDGDGANDLLLGAQDGQVNLLVNDVLAGRGSHEHPTQQEQVLARTALLQVDVRGPRGVVGAVVTVADAKGRVVGRRLIGGSPATGSRGPDAATLAVREPGEHHITVRWSDGATRTLTAQLQPALRTAVQFDRP